MPSVIGLTATINTTASATLHPLSIHVESDSDTVHELSVTIDGDDAAIAAGVVRERLLYCTLQLDLGSGFQTIHPSECRVLSVAASLDDWAKRCEIELYGAKWSPLVQDIVRGTMPVLVTTTSGDPSQPVTRTRFRGVAVSVTYDRVTKTARLSCLDRASQFAAISIGPSNEADSGATREEFFIDEMEAAGLTLGSCDFGPLATTQVTKPFSQVDVRLFDFGRGWVEPVGGWLQFDHDDKLVVERYSSLTPPAIILKPNDVVSLGPLTPPSTIATNKVTAVTINYDKVDASGLRTVQFSELTYDNYAIKGAIVRQDSAGTLTSVSMGDAAASNRLVREVRYTQTFLGDMLVGSRVEEWGWYARHAARLRLMTDLTVTAANINYRWQYDDGTWRLWPREHWVIVQLSNTWKNISANAVTRVSEGRAYWHFRNVALFELTGGPPPTESHNGGGSPIYITETSGGVDPTFEIGGVEVATLYAGANSFDEEIVTVYTTDADGYLVSEVVTTSAQSRGARATSQRAGSFVYGIDESSKEYWSDEKETFQVVSIKTTTYTPQVGADAYTITSRLWEAATNKLVIAPTEQRTGARPRPEQVVGESRSQELRQSATDIVRATLSGVVEDFVSNEYCQNEADLLSLARNRLREESAWNCPAVIPFNHAVRPGHYAEVDGYTEDGMDSMRLLVAGVVDNFDACTQSLALRYYPPEVADAE